MAAPTASMAMIIIGQGRPWLRLIAARALTSARVEPTDKSIPPVVMTKVMATATIRMGALWRQ